jgi:hypothetical protein
MLQALGTVRFQFLQKSKKKCHACVLLSPGFNNACKGGVQEIRQGSTLVPVHAHAAPVRATTGMVRKR